MEKHEWALKSSLGPLFLGALGQAPKRRFSFVFLFLHAQLAPSRRLPPPTCAIASPWRVTSLAACPLRCQHRAPARWTQAHPPPLRLSLHLLQLLRHHDLLDSRSRRQLLCCLLLRCPDLVGHAGFCLAGHATIAAFSSSTMVSHDA